VDNKESNSRGMRQEVGGVILCQTAIPSFVKKEGKARRSVQEIYGVVYSVKSEHSIQWNSWSNASVCKVYEGYVN